MSMIIFKGIVLGFIYAVTMVSGTVWASQVTLKGGAAAGFRVISAIVLAQIILCGLSLLALYGLLQLPFSLETPLRVIAAVTFLYMAYKMFRAPAATNLNLPEPMMRTVRLFSATFILSLTMPMRLGGYLAFGVASGMMSHGLTALTVPWVALVVGLGASVWFIYIVMLSSVFASKVPERVTLKNINKLNQLAGIVYLLVRGITLVPLLAGT